jgi:hypothetical protein
LNITNQWQDWIIKDGIVSSDGTFNNNVPAPSSTVPTPTLGAVRQSASDSQIIIMPPTADLTEEMKLFQCMTPSWKAWERETTSWEGMAEENTQKYIKSGVQLAE